MKKKSSIILPGDDDFNIEGRPLKLHELDIKGLAELLHSKKIRTSQGKIIQPLHSGHLEIVEDPARYKVLACGRRFGKCSDYEDSHTLEDGSVVQYKDLIGKNFKVFSYDENNQVIKTDAYCVDNGIKPVYKITTKYGLELKRTENHPLFTGEGWKSVEEGLVVGNRVFVPYKAPHEGSEPKDNKKLELLAYLLGDGSISQKTFSFTNNNETIVDNFIECLDGTCRIKTVNTTQEIFLHRNNEIYSLIEELDLYKTKSHNKFIPNWVFTCPNNQIALFLNRIYSCDGWASKSEIGYCSKSKELATGIKRLLSRLGIVSALCKKTVKSGQYKGNVYYNVLINNYSEIKKFQEEIGILGKEKALKECNINSKNSFNSQLQTLPKEFCTHFANKLKQVISYREQEKTIAGRVRPNIAVNRSKLRFYCSMFPELFSEESKIVEMEGYWDEIKQIEYLGERPTAAITVPKYHNYLNDCLEHNTLVVSLYAIAAMFQLRRRVWVCGPDYSLTEKVFRELYNILVTQMKIIVPGKSGRARNQKGDYYLETPWGSVLEAKSLENPDSLAGEALDLVIIDEAALNNDIANIWTQMLQPTLMDKEGSAIFISTPRSRNGFYKLFLQGQKGKKQREGKLQIKKDDTNGIDDDLTEWSSFQKTSYDNPLLAATPEKSKEVIDKAYKEAVYSGKLVQFKQEYLADFESVTDIVFPGFKTEITQDCKVPHVVDYQYHPDEGPVYAACDHNFAKPASTIFAQVNKFNDVVIFDEAFTPRTTTYQQAHQILSKEKELNKIASAVWSKNQVPHRDRYKIEFEEVVADVSGDQVQLNGRKAWDDFEEVLGYRPTGYKQDRETGCNLIRLWMEFPEFNERNEPVFEMKNEIKEQKTYPKLFVSSSCPNLIYALSTAKFKKSKNGTLKEDYEEVPEGYEGLLDALRYLLVRLFHNGSEYVTITEGF